MNKKHFCLITVILLPGMFGSALADTDWTNGGGDRAWDNSSNWSAGVPNSTVKIGVYGSSLRYFNGLIDDVRIYNRALSESDIARIAQ